jgi:ComEC/Rec2-related protein
MALVAGVVFFVLRALFALIPGLASARPIKKWSAMGALIAAFGYLLLSGSGVATQRSFIMTAIVLIGVMADRPALTLRTLSMAAFGVLLLAPQSVVHPSFQMSFAATLALIAAYERGLPWMVAGADTSMGARVALWGGREIAALILASMVAGLATTPYAAFHFHRLAPYGVIANLFAMPIVSVWVMPMGLLGLIAIPFGFDGMFWRLMGDGIEWMIAVALFVAHLPGAVGRMAAFGVGPLLLGTGGLILLCLLKTPLRWSGGLLVVIASVLAARTTLPDVLISTGGQALAVRGADGRLTIHRSGRDAFAVKEWLAADSDPRLPSDKTLKQEFRCDPSGCIAGLSDGRLVSHVMTADAFAEDCQRAAVVVTSRDMPAECKALTIDRQVSRNSGAMALRRNGDGFEIAAARPAGQDRPWALASALPDDTAAVATRPQPRDATPRPEDFGSRGLSRSVPPEQPHHLALDAHPRRRQDPHLIGRVGGLERNRSAAAAEAFEGRFLLIDQRHDNVARVGGFGLLDQHGVAFEDAGLDHRIAAHFQREMVAAAEHVGWHVDDLGLVLDRLDRRARRDPAHHWDRDRTAAVIFGTRAHTAERALDDAWGEAAPPHALADLVRQLDDLDGARPVGKAADEAALLQGRDQPVDAGFRPQIERVLHLVERGRNSGFFQPLVDEAQKLELLASEHAWFLPGFRRLPAVENKS